MRPGKYSTGYDFTKKQYKGHRQNHSNDRGYQYFQKYSDAQIATVKKIILDWKNKYNIPFKYDYDTLFTFNKTPFTGAKGIYTHNSVRTDKSDVFPQAELIAIIKIITNNTR